MDTIDRPDSNVPARFPADSSRMPAPIAAGSRDLAVASPAAAPITPRMLIRGLSRHWWRITLRWLMLSAPLASLIYAMVKPTFEAASLLRAEPTTPELYGPLHGSPNDREVQPYLLTQVELIKSNQVLEPALAREDISNLKM